MYLAISDGTTTLVLANSSAPAGNYALLRGEWTPRVARLRQNMQTWTTFEDVEEEFEIAVTGATFTNVNDNLFELYYMCERAQRWRFDHSAPRVSLIYAPTPSDPYPRRAIILNMSLEHTSTWTQIRQTRFAVVRLRMIRRGGWYSSLDLDYAAPQAIANGIVPTLAQRIQFPNPLQMVFPISASFEPSVSSTTPGGYFILSRYVPSRCQPSNTYPSGGGFSFVANTTAVAGWVMQFTSSTPHVWAEYGTAMSIQGVNDADWSLTPPPAYTLIIVARNASATATGMIRWRIVRGQEVMLTTPIVIPPNTPPRAYVVDIITPRQPISNAVVSIFPQALCTEAGATLQWDTLYFIPTLPYTTLILRHDPVPLNSVDNRLVINNFEHLNRTPAFGAGTGFGVVTSVRTYDMPTPTAIGSFVSYLWICPDGTNWRYIVSGSPVTYLARVRLHATYSLIV